MDKNDLPISTRMKNAERNIRFEQSFEKRKNIPFYRPDRQENGRQNFFQKFLRVNKNLYIPRKETLDNEYVFFQRVRKRNTVSSFLTRRRG